MSINFKSIEDQIKTNAPSFKMVSGAAALGQSKAPPIMPAVFILPAKETGEKSALIMAIDQRITPQFACLIYAKNAAQSLGKNTADDVQSLKNELRDALVGWQPIWADAPIQFLSWQVEGFDNQIFVWSDIYETSYRFRKT